MSADMFGEKWSVDLEIISGKKKRKPTPLKGHAWKPGTGPAGEICRTCLHYTVINTGISKFRKCGKNKSAWTKGPGSDIRAKDRACKFWEPSS